MSAPQPFAVLLLAGRRAETDPLLEQTGYRHKALIPVGGVPMLARAAAAVAAQAGLERVVVSSEDATLIADVPELAASFPGLTVEHHKSADSPAASVCDYLDGRADDLPVLVTTADHALLTDQMVRYFWQAATTAEADVAVAVVAASVFRRRYPTMRRTFIRLGDDEFSGANLFAFRTKAASKAARFWMRAEDNRKRPLRLAATLGVPNVLRYLCGRLDAPTAIREASRIIGVRVALVELPFAEAAIDVDRPEDLAAVSRIVAADAPAA